MARKKKLLATLQKVREIARDESRRRLAEALQAEEVLDGQWQELQQEQEVLQAYRNREAAPQNFNLNNLLNTQRHQLVLDAQRTVLEQQQTALAEETEKRRKVLTMADQSVRTIERLQERAAQEEEQETLRIENISNDEIATQTFLRNRNS